MGAKLVHFEITADDPEKLAKFYTAVLGWNIEPPIEEMGGYMLIKTDEAEDAIGGGMYKKMQPGQAPLNYYDVKSIEDTVAKVKELGGQVVMEKMTVPKMGYMAVLLDPEGQAFGLWIADMNAA